MRLRLGCGSEKDAKGNETTYKYTATGDLAERNDPSGLVTRYTYDTLGRVKTSAEISAAYPAGVVSSFSYDGLGRLVAHTGAGAHRSTH
ncbi:hypothetical protein ACGFIV_16190 [Sphaerisporangium sp. NPDC049003]|uniref:hypothetical protein n=1 Tax=Sphaerisporangium sp. NPDC049003 TaxID=3364517 RepID=UPI003724260A